MMYLCYMTGSIKFYRFLNFAVNILASVKKLVEKGEITEKGIDVIVNRLNELAFNLKALKKKLSK